VLLPVLHQVAQKLFAVGNGRRLSKTTARLMLTTFVLGLALVLEST